MITRPVAAPLARVDREPAPPPPTLPPRTAVARGRAASAAAWTSLVGFGVVFATVRARASDAVDLAVTLKLQRRSHPAFTRLMELVSWPGFPPQSRMIPTAIIAALWLGRLRVEASLQALGWGTALLSMLVKGAMRRSRPVAGRDLRVIAARLGGSSFPSGHVITYVGTYGFLAVLVHALMRPVLVRRAVVGTLVGLLALIGPSRIHQGHHWMTDVVASYLLGLSYLIGLAALYRRVKARGAGVRP